MEGGVEEPGPQRAPRWTRFRFRGGNIAAASSAHDLWTAGWTGATKSRVVQKSLCTARIVAAMAAKSRRDGKSETLAFEATYENHGLARTETFTTWKV